jgi:hypothetical protein
LEARLDREVRPLPPEFAAKVLDEFLGLSEGPRESSPE